MSKRGYGSSGVEYRYNRRKSLAKKQKKEEARWAKRSGEVITYKVGEQKPDIPKP